MLLFLVMDTSVPPAPRQTQSAIATIRILQYGKSSKSVWNDQPGFRKREIVVQEKDGRKTIVRLIEFE